WNGVTKAPGWFWLDDERQAQLTQARPPLIAAQLSGDYRPHHPAATEARVLDALVEADQWGFDDRAAQEGCLRLGRQSSEEFFRTQHARQILARQDLAKGEKLDALEQTIA